MSDTAPDAALRDQIAETLAGIWPTSMNRNAEYHRQQILAAADLVIAKVVAAPLTAARDELKWVRAELAKADAENNAAGKRAERAEAAVQRARELHPRDDSSPHGPWCGVCLSPWPCRTLAALDRPADPPAKEKP